MWRPPVRKRLISPPTVKALEAQLLSPPRCHAGMPYCIRLATMPSRSIAWICGKVEVMLPIQRANS